MYKLLLVVDEVFERRLLYKNLQKHIGNQFEIYKAVDEKEAMEMFEKEKIQIAVFIKKEQMIFVKAVNYILKPYEEQKMADVIKEVVLEHDIGRVREASVFRQAIKETEDSRLLKIKRRIEWYVEKHYMEEISVHDAAEQMNYSEAYFCKLFKQCFGMNFTSFLAKYRIEKAKKLLQTSGMNIKEVGKVCGYPDPCYFTRVFKREEGCTPSEYRNRYINEELE